MNFKRICSKILTIGCFLSLLLILCQRDAFLEAQELGYGGLSPINHSMAGATTALPMDGSGAIFWNPATLGDLQHGEVQLGFGRINAPWYGDESLAFTVISPVVLGLWLASESDDEDFWKKDKDDDYDSTDKRRKELQERHEQLTNDGGSASGSGGNEAELPIENDGGETIRYTNPESYDPSLRGFSFTLVYPTNPEKRINFGLGISETGSLKKRFLVDAESGVPQYAVLYRVKGIEVSPTLSYRFSKRFYMGISPVLGFNEFPEASLPQFPELERTSDRVHLGFGLQWGAYYRSREKINYGLSLRSPHWSPAQEVQWKDDQGTVITKKLHCSPEQPMRCSFGIAYTGLEKFKFSADFRYYDFHHLASLYESAGGSYRKYATSYALGMQFAPNEHESIFSFRLGYQYTDCGRSWNDYYYNTTLPISGGHSIHYGVSLGTPSMKGWEISFSLSHGFGGERTEFYDGTSVRSFRDNPNQTSFWWAIRHKR